VNVLTCDWDCNKGTNNPNGVFSGAIRYNWWSELIKEPQHCTILSRIWDVTIDGVWIGEWIYWSHVYTTRNYTLQITDTHRPTSWVYYSFCGQAVARWLTLHIWTLSTQLLRRTAPTELPTELTIYFLSIHSTDSNWITSWKLPCDWRCTEDQFVFETHNQIFFFTELLRSQFLCNNLSEEKMGVSYEYAWPFVTYRFCTYT
jgi:hypothetical protein